MRTWRKIPEGIVFWGQRKLSLLSWHVWLKWVICSEKHAAFTCRLFMFTEDQQRASSRDATAITRRAISAKPMSLLGTTVVCILVSERKGDQRNRRSIASPQLQGWHLRLVTPIQYLTTCEIRSQSLLLFLRWMMARKVFLHCEADLWPLVKCLYCIILSYQTSVWNSIIYTVY